MKEKINQTFDLTTYEIPLSRLKNSTLSAAYYRTCETLCKQIRIKARKFSQKDKRKIKLAGKSINTTNKSSSAVHVRVFAVTENNNTLYHIHPFAE